MRALRWHGRRDLRVDEIARPTAGTHQAVVRVERVGLCGTDLEEYLHGPVDIPSGTPHHRSGAIAPLTIGHEVVGIVAECPSDPSLVGQRVIPDVVEGCGECFWCQRHEEGLCPDLVVLGQHADGGLAEYMVCRAATLVPVPDTLSPDTAAFAEPTAVAARAVAKAGDLRGTTVIVVGAGVVGNLIAQVARGHGALVITQDPAPHRREIAATMGFATAAERHESAQLCAEHSAGRLADVVFECAGRQQSLDDAISLTRRGGTTVLVGLDPEPAAFPWRDVVLGEKRLIGTAAHMWDVDVLAAVRLLASGVVDPSPLLSRVVAMDAAASALDELAAPNHLAKVLVDPQMHSAEGANA
ncbi:alcohol dehydrogenase catalytic domain-containing protein [Microbacterium sp. H1-D42]|uniref:zinc-binding dehydrogenase n=1 Tax=Microbacterium sp. H1-D42 TaxID=2925844 RepID=UPI001F52F006|nr:alcohol dehydrogenase catalytic domain-containing protein [Microbacterium sp. H1-D42]UNK70469.1 alcohol dehydrogenase catalytic domain-containing protein [Microbacterium sp. H1-D42]